MSALVEAGLRLVLADDRSAEGQPNPLAPLPSWNSDGHLAEICNREELYRAMEGE